MYRSTILFITIFIRAKLSVCLVSSLCFQFSHDYSVDVYYKGTLVSLSKGFRVEDVILSTTFACTLKTRIGPGKYSVLIIQKQNNFTKYIIPCLHFSTVSLIRVYQSRQLRLFPARNLIPRLATPRFIDIHTRCNSVEPLFSLMRTVLFHGIFFGVY